MRVRQSECKCASVLKGVSVCVSGYDRKCVCECVFECVCVCFSEGVFSRVREREIGLLINVG